MIQKTVKKNLRIAIVVFCFQFSPINMKQVDPLVCYCNMENVDITGYLGITARK